MRNLFISWLYLSRFPWRALLLLWQLRILLLLLRAPTPPRPLFWGREVPKKRKSPAWALALGHVYVGVGVVGTTFAESWSLCVEL
jgi:hypothetical protein